MPKSSDLGRFFKHSSIYAVGNIINRIGAFLLLPLYTNYLSVAEYGQLELFYSIFAVVSGLVGAGFSHATLRFYFEYDSLKDRHEVVVTNLLVSMLITLFGVALVGQFAEFLVDLLFNDQTLVLALYIGLLTVVLEVSSQICLAYVRAVENSVLFIVLALIKLVIQVVANTVLIIVYEAGITGVLFGNLLAVLAGWLILIFFVLRRCGRSWDFGKLKEVVLYSYPFIFSSIVGIARGNADKFLINGLIGAEALGIYALALKFAQLLETLVGEPFRNAYGAFRFSVMKQENAAQIQADIFRLLMIGSLVIAMGLSMYTIDVLRLMSDPSFHQAAYLLPLLLLAYMASIGVYVAQSGILIAKKTKYLIYISSLTAIVSVVSNYLLITWFSVQGACLAMLITALFGTGANEWVSRRYFKVDYEYQKLAQLAMLGLITYLGYLGILQIGSFELALKTLWLICFLYLILKLPLFKDEEKDTIYRFVAVRLGLKSP